VRASARVELREEDKSDTHPETATEAEKIDMRVARSFALYQKQR
jgi:hypothetical protein